jgi:hypothetical protein
VDGFAVVKLNFDNYLFLLGDELYLSTLTLAR